MNRTIAYVVACIAVVVLGVTGTVDNTSEMLALLVGLGVPSPITTGRKKAAGA